MKIKAISLLISLVLLSHPCVFAQSLPASVDSLLSATYAEDEPGAVFLIARGGEVILEKAYGMANLELVIPMKTNNVFEIGSLTKQFTAISVLLLEEQGKLSVQDEITKYIPDYPVNDQVITIHHLLTHTSGIKNFTRVKGLNAIANTQQSPSEFIDFFKHEPLDFEPGTQFKYSNSAYIILGHIIEVVSNQTYEEFVMHHIFTPLEMDHSRYSSHDEVIPDRAYGYHKRDDYINRRHISFSIPYASGALMSTVADMHKWNEALKNNTLISEETQKKVFTNHTLTSGDPINYGYGWHIKNIDDHRSYEHGGSIFGFKSMGVYLPDLDIYVIGLTNCDCNSPTQITRQIASLVAQGN